MPASGRKSKYESLVKPFLARIEHLCRMGATEEEICSKIGVSVSSFNVYKNQHPELLEALKQGKIDADDAVEAALFRRATGYSYEEVRTNSYADSNDNQRQFRSVVTRELPPDVTAAIFWLKNRRPERWRDRHELQADITEFSPQEKHARDLVDSLEPEEKFKLLREIVQHDQP